MQRFAGAALQGWALNDKEGLRVSGALVALVFPVEQDGNMSSGLSVQTVLENLMVFSFLANLYFFETRSLCFPHCP